MLTNVDCLSNSFMPKALTELVHNLHSLEITRWEKDMTCIMNVSLL